MDVSQEDKQRYDYWQKSNKRVKCYILAFMSNIIQHQMHDLWLASGILTSLKMFDEQISCVAWSDTIRTLLNVKMAKGTPVRDHCYEHNLNADCIGGLECRDWWWISYGYDPSILPESFN